MENEKNIVSEFNNFLAKSFSTKKSDWSEYVNFFAAKFLNSFYDNLPFMEQQMKIYKNSKKNLTEIEKSKQQNIHQFFSLFSLIDVDSKEQKITVDIDKIDLTFKKVINKEEKDFILEGIKGLDDALKATKSARNNATFDDLSKKFNLLIGYIKEENVRNAFFKEFLLSDKKFNINKTISNPYCVSTN